jgi:hypothetical protein
MARAPTRPRTIREGDISMTGSAIVLRRSGDESETDRALIVLEGIQSQLATVATVEQAKGIGDQAAAVLAFAKRSKMALEVQNRCACLRLTAERRAGELLEQIDRLKGRPSKGSHSKRLSDIGVDYNQSCRWRALARLSADSLDRMRQECDRFNEELTTNLVMRHVRSRLSPEEFGKLVRPWESWGDRPHDKQVHDAINHLFRSLPAVLKADGDADEHLDVVLHDQSYLQENDLEQLRDILTNLRARVERWLTATRRRIEGYPPEPPSDGLGLLAFAPGHAERATRRAHRTRK